MKIIKKINSLFIILIFVTGCGFKIENNIKKNNFSIKEIQTSGDNRINFKIKNYLLSNSKKNATNSINLSLKTKKTKTIKEKNINNEITKYEVNIFTLVEFYLNNTTKNTLNISSAGSYIVAEKNYSTTLSNERTIVENLTENISEKILEEINLKINDN